MKTKTSLIVLGLMVSLIWGTAAQAAPRVTRERAAAHYPPHTQKGMRHYVAEQGVTYTYINGVPQPVPCEPPPPPVVVQQPVYVAAPVVVPAPPPPVVQTYETHYAPPPPNPPACFLYMPWVRPGISISLRF